MCPSLLLRFPPANVPRHETAGGIRGTRPGHGSHVGIARHQPAGSSTVTLGWPHQPGCASGGTTRLLDDLVRPGEHRGRDRQAECLRGLKVNDEAPGDAFDGKIAGHCTAQHLRHQRPRCGRRCLPRSPSRPRTRTASGAGAAAPGEIWPWPARPQASGCASCESLAELFKQWLDYYTLAASWLSEFLIEIMT
jgi:hypothetical protein